MPAAKSSKKKSAPKKSDKLLTLFQHKTFTMVFFLVVFGLLGGAVYLWKSSAAVGTRQLVYTYDSKYYSVAPTGGASTDLGLTHGCSELSPAGTKIAYSGYNLIRNVYHTNISIRNVSGGKAKRLTNTTGDYNAQSDYCPAFNGDGTAIAYVRETTTVEELRIVNTDGTNDKLVYTSANNTLMANLGDNPVKWVPGTNTLVFVDATQGKILSINTDGTGLKTLVDNNAAYIGLFGVRTLTNGTKRILYVSDTGFSTMLVDGTDVKNVAVNSTGSANPWLSYGLDADWVGDKVAYIESSSTNGQPAVKSVWTANYDGSGKVKIFTSTTESVDSLDASAQGTSIAVSMAPSGAPFQNSVGRIVTMNPDGTGGVTVFTGDGAKTGFVVDW